jgi:hypothetical protein
VYVAIPGSLTSWRSLDEMLAQFHEQDRADRERRIVERLENGIPLDDSTDWTRVASALVAAQGQAERQETQALRGSLQSILGLTAGALAPLPASAGEERFPGILVRLRAMRVGELTDLLGAVRSAMDAGGDRAVLEAMRAFVAVAVGAVSGLESDEGPIVVEADGGSLPADALDVLEAALPGGGLLVSLFRASRDYQGLSGDEKKAFGLRLPPTSPASIAASVLDISGGSMAATATATPVGSAGHSTRTAPVLVGTPLGTNGSETRTPFGP